MLELQRGTLGIWEPKILDIVLLTLLLVVLSPRTNAATSSIDLTATPNPAQFGYPVTITATLSPVQATGSVTFYDGAALLGSGQLSGGRATLTTSLLPSGMRSLRAYYSGDSTLDPSNSGILAQVVTGLRQNGFQPVKTYSTGNVPVGVAIGDFNADGKVDLVFSNYLDGNVSVLLGNGDGTFQPAKNFTADASRNPIAVVAGDFNRDGKIDLAVLSNIRLSDSVGTITILLGNDDGTFRQVGLFQVGNEPSSLAMGDFNGDGRPDLVVANSLLDNGAVSVMLGNGDGSFQSPVIYAVGSVPEFVGTGDFNSDGHTDLAVTNYQSASVSLLFGNGDGTFAPAVNFATDKGPTSLAAGDFNHDGSLDLAIANSTADFGGVVSICLGNGDGTFQNAAKYFAGTTPVSITVADVSGDGNSDLIVTNRDSSYLSVLLGNNDGTFQVAANYPVGMLGQSAVVADFNGDGIADVTVSFEVGNTIGVLLGIVPGPLSQTITFQTLSDVMLGAGSFRLSATASSGLPVSFTVTTPTICTLEGDIGVLHAVGTCSVTATQGGNATYAAAPQIAQSFQVIGPLIAPGGIGSLFSSSPIISPGSWISIYGSDLSSSVNQWNGDFPTYLGGTSVMIDEEPAYLSYVSPGQINLQVPDDIPLGTALVQVRNFNMIASSVVEVDLASPSFCLLGDGKHVVGQIATPNGSGAYGGGAYDLVGPTNAFGFPTRPVKPGEIMTLYGVGFGPTNPTVPAGKAFSGAALTTSPVAITIGGVQAAVSFSGMTEAGLYQFNLTVPGVNSGDQPLQASVGGAQTQSGIVITIQ